MKKIFITGIAGFIGFHLAKALRERGDVVAGCDDFNDYYPAQLKYDRAEILQNMGVDVREANILQIRSLESYFKKEGFTHIVNLAAQAGVRYSLTNPQAYTSTNVDGFLEVLELCRSLKDVSLVYASSSSVYGENKKVPSSESDPISSPSSLYAATKISNEMMAHSYHHLFKFPVIGLRFFTVYGPWGRPDMAMYSFAKAIVDGEPIEVFNHGKMQRDFTYIDDIIQGTVAAIDSSVTCEVFNLGNGEPIELKEFIHGVEEFLGKKANIIYKPMQPGDVTTSCADISKAHDILGYQPKTPIREGTKHFIDWMVKYHELA